jgi:hypothetical protein
MMFGKLARGSTAKPGSLLLGRGTFGDDEPFLIIPFVGPEDKQCIVISQSADVFVGAENWFEDYFWDLSSLAEIDVDPSKFSIGKDSARPGDIAYAESGKWMIGAVVEERTKRATWLMLADGQKVANGTTKILFPAWRLVVRQGDKAHILFERQITASSE